ncbi:hypothetical protein ACQP3L_39320, partial [Escherichia coli]
LKIVFVWKTREIVWQLRTLVVRLEDPGSTPAPTWWLTTIQEILPSSGFLGHRMHLVHRQAFSKTSIYIRDFLNTLP